MALRSLREGAGGGLGKFILFGFLVLACAGLVMTDVGGFFRGGITSTDVAEVDGEPISAQSFDRTVRRTLGRLGIDTAEAYRLGLIDQILNAEIRAALIQSTAREKGILIDEDRVAKQIETIVRPLVQDGQSPADVFNQILMSQNMSEAEFVQSMKRDMSSQLLMQAVQGGPAASAPFLLEDLYRYEKEQRAVEYITLPHGEIVDLPEMNEDQLLTLYESTKERYAIPERRKYKILKIDDRALRQTLDISEEEIRNYYDDNIDLYKQPETWVAETALLNNRENAEDVTEKMNGTSLKQAVKAVTGFERDYLGSQNITSESIPEAVREDFLSAKSSGAVIGPVQTPLGWQIYAITDYQPAQTRSFEQAKSEIREELTQDLLLDQLYSLSNTMDDLLASGLGVKEVQQEIAMEVIDLPEMNAYGLDDQGRDAMANHESYKRIVNETGQDLMEGETSPVLETADGAFIALHLESVTPKTYKEFEDVKQKIQSQWISDQKRLQNQERVRALVDKINQESVGLATIAKQEGKTIRLKKGLTRQATESSDLPDRALAQIFSVSANESESRAFIFETADGLALARIAEISLPQEIDHSSESYKAFVNRTRQELSEDNLLGFLESKNRRFGTNVNTNMLERMYGLNAQTF